MRKVWIPGILGGAINWSAAIIMGLTGNIYSGLLFLVGTPLVALSLLLTRPKD